MLTSVVMTRKWDFHKMAIDMSRAFDTIKRKCILDVLLQAGCNDDQLRLVRSLLAGTKLRVRVKTELSKSFETTIRSPQGDSLSPVLFTCYLAAALSSVPRKLHQAQPTCLQPRSATRNGIRRYYHIYEFQVIFRKFSKI